MRWILSLSLILSVLACDQGPELIPHTVKKDHEMGKIKISWIVRVDPITDEEVGLRLPRKEELAAISKSLKKDHDRTFVVFLLPGMKEGAGAFATAHHNPNLEVKINDFLIPDRYKSIAGK